MLIRVEAALRIIAHATNYSLPTSQNFVHHVSSIRQASRNNIILLIMEWNSLPIAVNSSDESDRKSYNGLGIGGGMSLKLNVLLKRSNKAYNRRWNDHAEQVSKSCESVHNNKVIRRNLHRHEESW